MQKLIWPNARPRAVELRRLTRLIVLIACVMVLCLPGESWSVVVPALSPLAAAALVLSTWTLPAFAVLGLVLALVACWRHRWFCHWVCPTGYCADGATWLGRRCGRRLRRVPTIGPALALITLAGACLGYPVLLWMDPLALLSSAIGPLPDRPGAVLSWGSLGFVLIVAISMWWPHAWCARLCPLGGLQDVLTPTGQSLVRIVQRCLPRSRAMARERPGCCIGPATTLVPGRRGRSGVGHMSGVVESRTRETAASAGCRGRREVLQPMSAMRELCTRVPRRNYSGRYGTVWHRRIPRALITYDTDYCRESCNQCTQVCPSGAISAVMLERKVQAAIGVPVVDMSVCLLGAGRECAVCRNRCPYAAIRLVFDEKEYTLTPEVDLTHCNGCGACQVACPTQPGKAIVVRPVADVY